MKSYDVRSDMVNRICAQQDILWRPESKMEQKQTLPKQLYFRAQCDECREWISWVDLRDCDCCERTLCPECAEAWARNTCLECKKHLDRMEEDYGFEEIWR